MVVTAVVPRWEWRTFAEHLGELGRHFDALESESVQESDEVYVLSPMTDASVKLRDGLIDVKVLERVSDDGLQQWKPVLKADYPEAATDVRLLLEALGVVVLRVHKRRAHYSVGGCMAERSEVRTAHGASETVAIESEDPDRLRAALRELGLDPHRNVSMARGLKVLAGIGAHRYAVIDCGTNSVKFHVGERRADGTWTTIVDRAEVTRLGEGLDETGALRDEPIARTVAAIAAMADEARRDGAEAIAAVGTAGLRIAANRSAVVDAVRERAGVELEVIGGEEEGRLAYLAVKAALGLGRGSLVVFDTGGGSSQFTFGDGDRVDERFSVDVGAARFTERFGLDRAVGEDTVAAALEAIAADLTRLDGRPAPQTLVGMGGAVTNLTAVAHRLARYDPEIVQGAVLDRAEIDRQIELYRTRDADERREIVGLQPNRAAVILAGACIVRTVLGKLGRDALTVSDRRLRHGLLAERFGS